MRSDFYQVTVWVLESADQFMTASQYCVRNSVLLLEQWTDGVTELIDFYCLFTADSRPWKHTSASALISLVAFWTQCSLCTRCVMLLQQKQTHTPAWPTLSASPTNPLYRLIRIMARSKKKSLKWAVADGQWLQPCVIWAAFRAGLLRRYGCASGERWREGSWHADGKALLVCDRYCADTVTKYTQEVIFLTIVSLPLIIQDLTYSIF